MGWGDYPGRQKRTLGGLPCKKAGETQATVIAFPIHSHPAKKAKPAPNLFALGSDFYTTVCELQRSGRWCVRQRSE